MIFLRNVKIGEPLPELFVPSIDRSVVERYAAASGDSNPLHLDDSYAQSVGLPRALVHGSYVMGLMERLLRDWWQDVFVRRLEVQFVRPVFYDAALLFTGRVARISADGMIIRIITKESNSICCVAAAECSAE